MRATFPNLRFPELNEAVRLRKWSCEELGYYRSEVAGKPGATAWVLAHSIADAQGQRAFADDDIPELGRQPFQFAHIVNAALEYNSAYGGIDEREQEFVDSYEKRFWFLLAGHLGKTVAELQATMSFDEFKDWLAYARRRPIGDDLADIHTAMVSQAVLATIPRRRGSKVPKVSELIVDWWKPRKQTQRQIVQTLEMVFASMKQQKKVS